VVTLSFELGWMRMLPERCATIQQGNREAYRGSDRHCCMLHTSHPCQAGLGRPAAANRRHRMRARQGVAGQGTSQHPLLSARARLSSRDAMGWTRSATHAAALLSYAKRSSWVILSCSSFIQSCMRRIPSTHEKALIYAPWTMKSASDRAPSYKKSACSSS